MSSPLQLDGPPPPRSRKLSRVMRNAVARVEGSAVTYVVAVRELCDFTAKQGDLDIRFTPSPSAVEGMEGHITVASNRREGYQTEITLSGDFESLHVRGRADGYDPELGQLEEFKTHCGDWSRIPANHRHRHWAQLKIYGWLFCRERGVATIRLALVYFDIVSERETLLSETCSAEALREHFEAHCRRFIHWAQLEVAHREARDRSLRALTFPHPEFHTGQRELAEAVFRAAKNGRCLLAQAPTGSGKTLGTVFPLLKAMPTERLDKIFFLVAKTPGRDLALGALQCLQESAPALQLRVMELVARDKACENPGSPCDGAKCPLARGFYDRLPLARQAAIEHGLLDRASLRAIALRHQVCPYYLGQDVARWCDVVIGDYNYYFDTSAMLYSLTRRNEWKVSVLIDEAHNLISRARKMYSASLQRADLRAVMHAAPAKIRSSLVEIDRHWDDLLLRQEPVYCVYTALPRKLIGALQQLNTVVTRHLSENPFGLDGPLQRVYFDTLNFCRLAEFFDDCSLLDVTKSAAVGDEPGNAELCLRNIIPAGFLQRRFAAAHATVLFSATLSPPAFHRNVLGLPENTAWLDVRSPFVSEQLRVEVVGSISTRYTHRTRSVLPIVKLLARQYRQTPGNYLAFFSSFEYLKQVADAVQARHPDIPLWRQERQMSEAERTAFLANFEIEGCGVGFAVLGGAFAEGIDLPGKRLIGAFVVTLGLPQINEVNEEIRQRMETAFGAGYDYTYLYPGVQKVVQAAGRVIRTRTDRGVVYLVDDRYSQAKVRKLLPRWWNV